MRKNPVTYQAEEMMPAAESGLRWVIRPLTCKGQVRAIGERAQAC